ncbi:hypothetical protein [Frigidibacter sp. ROC022]|uniref:hypothetical protein n=1 Tax=Frigidibacter sp. ROC022 TaxID=2971796 RepID=UPI00215B665C|nr:hypothetical protein [Frigidibacter sp. ROC022]MCR8725084.1 hypothetical protein [Frigidibacter sp. ROC022]
MFLILVFLTIAVAALASWRQSDRRADREEMDRLIALQPSAPPVSKNVARFTLATHVEAGNMFGTDDYFPFFIADVSSISCPGAE